MAEGASDRNDRGMRRDLLGLASLALALAACTVAPATPSHDAGSPPTATEPAPAPAGDPLPAELRGTWLDRWSTSMQYELAEKAYDFDTGVWFEGRPDLWDMAPYRGFGLALAADGSFFWIREEDGGLGGCKSYGLVVMKGTVTAGEGTLRFHPSAVRQRYESTCDPSLNFDRALPNDEIVVTFTHGLTNDGARETLRLDEAASGTGIDYFKR